MFHISRRHLHHLIADIGVLAALNQGGHAHRVALIALGQFCNHRRHGGRKQQCAAGCRRFAQHEFQIFAKAQIQHFVGFIQNHSANIAQFQRAAFNMVAQAARGAHNDMGAAFQRAAFLAGVHAPDARCHARPGAGIQPFDFAAHLQRQFARGCHDQRQGGGGCAQTRFALQQRFCDGQAKPHGFPRPGLRRYQKVGTGQFGRGDRLLNLGQGVVPAFCEGFGKGRDHVGKCPF